VIATRARGLKSNFWEDKVLGAVGERHHALEDIRDRYRPVEVAALVPAAPDRLVDHRPGRARVIQSADVFVDASGIVYSTDYNAGLHIMEYGG
jgi:hypothetical protein